MISLIIIIENGKYQKVSGLINTCLTYTSGFEGSEVCQWQISYVPVIEEHYAVK